MILAKNESIDRRHQRATLANKLLNVLEGGAQYAKRVLARPSPKRGVLQSSKSLLARSAATALLARRGRNSLADANTYADIYDLVKIRMTS